MHKLKSLTDTIDGIFVARASAPLRVGVILQFVLIVFTYLTLLFLADLLAVTGPYMTHRCQTMRAV